MRSAVIVLLILFCTAAAPADVHLPAIISDNMVLQRSAQTPLWGTAKPFEKISIEYKHVAVETVADAKGQWRADLNVEKVDSAPGEMVIHASNTIRIQNVIVGEVWLCSGQSNMSFTVDGSDHADREALDFPSIRQFLVPPTIAFTPQHEIAGQWVVATSQTAKLFTAVGFFFAREVFQKTGHAIGLIHASWGGTGAEAWTSESQMKSDPELGAMYDHFRSAMAGASDEAAKLRNDPSMPSVLYDGMISPLIRYRIRGVLWYQGEGNELRWPAYERLLTRLIEGWRKDWQIGSFPFYIVQLAGFRERSADPNTDSGWVKVRAAQERVARTVPNCELATAIDIGDAVQIHPTNKQDVGKRLAAIALAKEYGQTNEYAGPTFQSMAVQGNTVRLTFTHAKGLLSRAAVLKDFAIAGSDGKFFWADAHIEGEQVVVSTDAVSVPRRVRYAWSDNPETTLYNGDNFPAFPFDVSQP